MYETCTPGQYRRHSSRPVSCSTAQTIPSAVCVYIRPPPHVEKCLIVPFSRRIHLIRKGGLTPWAVTLAFVQSPKLVNQLCLAPAYSPVRGLRMRDRARSFDGGGALPPGPRTYR